MRSQTTIESRLRRVFGTLAFGFAVFGFAACDGLLEVELPGDLTSDETLVPRNAGMLVLSAIAEFECALDDFVVTTGGMEFSYWAGTGWGPFRGSDDHTIINVGTALCGTVFTGTGNGYMNMQRSRVLAETAYDHIVEWGPTLVDDYEGLLATAATTIGFNLAFFGDSFCEMALDRGALITPEQVHTLAEEWFTKAIQHADAAGAPVSSVATDDVGTMARLGRARARLALDDLEGAAADAAMIPEGYLAVATRSGDTDQRRNSIVQRMTEDRAVTVHEQMRDLTISADGRTTQRDGVPDPRVPVEETDGTTQNSNIPLWIQTKYASHSDPVPIAKWQEAQYILAEVAARNGDAGTAAGHINDVRDFYGLPMYPGGTAAEVMSQIIEERRREFFFEGRYHGDKIRYGIPFPMGQMTNPITGLVYGTASCFLMPTDEYNSNPNLQ
jgi:starch-binding outer membrane protein, SusD/RagB family